MKIFFSVLTFFIVYSAYSLLYLKANTEILVGIKVELEEPKPEKPDTGRLEFFVDW